MTTFPRWLAGHRAADTAIGDLARDVEMDPEFPTDPRDLDEVRAHLDDMHADPAAVDTATRAWARYVAETHHQEGTP